MPKAVLYNMDGDNLGEIELSDVMFGAEVNKTLIHEAVVNFLANRRAGTAAAKTRSEVRGGGRKPWRQKGTGRARQGSIRAPQWIGGGIVFGPKPRDYSYNMPKKARRAALRSALSARAGEGKVSVVDKLTLAEPKTRVMVNFFNKIGLYGKVLLVAGEADDNIAKSVRNIQGVTFVPANGLNAYDVVNHDNLIVTQDALARVEEVFGQ
jgi:large subunit ribosomal protein L4